MTTNDSMTTPPRVARAAAAALAVLLVLALNAPDRRVHAQHAAGDVATQPPPAIGAVPGAVIGFVVDIDGDPIAGAMVSLVDTRPPDVPIASGGRRSAVTNDEGRFRLGGLSPGHRAVTVTAPRFAGAEVPDVDFVAGETTVVAVTLYPFR